MTEHKQCHRCGTGKALHSTDQQACCDSCLGIASTYDDGYTDGGEPYTAEELEIIRLMEE